MRSRFLFLAIVAWMLTLCVIADVEIYFAPNGGFAEINNNRKITLKSGTEVPATLNYALIDLIERTPEGGQIKMAMYAFSYEPTEKALMDAARDRGVKVKLILDACAEWTEEIRTGLKKRIEEQRELAKKEGRTFDFQLKEIYPELMKQRERTRTLDDGTVIYGTMHQKFGVFYDKGNKLPVNAFCGSANVSWGAGHLFAENRILFKNEPHVALQLAEEFARLWNEYGKPATDNCESERFLQVENPWGPIKIVSNSKPIDIEHYQRIDKTLEDILDKVNPNGGTIDVAMFSFTHYNLAMKLLYLAKRNPNIKVRILMDQTQIEDDENHRGVLGPYMERKAFYDKLNNFEIRYKWRSNAYGYDQESRTPQLLHQKNLLLHHKCAVVNRNLMGLGSYNWSESAEERNFENIMVFNGSTPENQEVVDRFMAEFDFIWNSLKKDEVISQKLPNPQVIEGERGRDLKKKIVKAYKNFICRKIMELLEKNKDGSDFTMLLTELLDVAKIDEKELTEKLQWLKDVTLIFETEQEGKKMYFLAD